MVKKKPSTKKKLSNVKKPAHARKLVKKTKKPATKALAKKKPVKKILKSKPIAKKKTKLVKAKTKKTIKTKKPLKSKAKIALKAKKIVKTKTKKTVKAKVTKITKPKKNLKGKVKTAPKKKSAAKAKAAPKPKKILKKKVVEKKPVPVKAVSKSAAAKPGKTTTPPTKNITPTTQKKMTAPVLVNTAPKFTTQAERALNLKEIKSPATAYYPKDSKPIAKKDYMNAKNLGRFRQALLKWKQDLMAGVDKTIHHMQDEAANFADPNDRATQEEEFSLELRTRDRERKLMIKIDEALERIDNGEYGFCEECGIEIGLERLEARPTATLCIDCKTLAEIREKQVAG